MKPPSLWVLREREPSAVEIDDFFRQASMSQHARLVFLSFGPAEQARRFGEWHAATLEEELRLDGMDGIEVISEEAYKKMSWRCRWGREVEFFD